MSRLDEAIELVRGSGNVFRDLGHPNPDLEQARILIAIQIARVLDARGLSTRDAEKLTGVAHTEFSRIRNAQLRRFTLDRLVTILEKLDGDIEVKLIVQPRRHRAAHADPIPA